MRGGRRRSRRAAGRRVRRTQRRRDRRGAPHSPDRRPAEWRTSRRPRRAGSRPRAADRALAPRSPARSRTRPRTGRSRQARPRREPGLGGRSQVPIGCGSSSSSLEFGRHEQKRQRLLAQFGAHNRLARLPRRRVAEDRLHGCERIGGACMRCPMNQARSSRDFMPSGEDQASLRSEKPLGPAGRHRGMPSRLSAWR